MEMILFAGQHGGVHPMEFCAMNTGMGELGSEVVGMESFDEAELDQYLPAHAAAAAAMSAAHHARQHPPPYATDNGNNNASSNSSNNSNNNSSSNAVSSWSNSTYRMSSAASPGSGTQPLSHMSDGSPHTSPQLSPNAAGLHNTASNVLTNTIPAHSNNGLQHSSHTSEDYQASERYNDSPQNNSIKMEEQAYQRDSKYYDMHAHAQGRYNGFGGGMQSMGLDYSSTADNMQAYFGQAGSMYSGSGVGVAPPPYQCMAAGLRPIYQGSGSSTITVAPINGASQWERYATRP